MADTTFSKSAFFSNLSGWLVIVGLMAVVVFGVGLSAGKKGLTVVSSTVQQAR